MLLGFGKQRFADIEGNLILLCRAAIRRTKARGRLVLGHSRYIARLHRKLTKRYRGTRFRCGDIREACIPRSMPPSLHGRISADVPGADHLVTIYRVTDTTVSYAANRFEARLKEMNFSIFFQSEPLQGD